MRKKTKAKEKVSMSKKKTSYKVETKSSPEQVKHWQTLYQLFAERPMDDDNLFVNLGMFMRSSALAKVLFINELYEIIRDIPGVIVEFGTWWGQNVILFENLRAINEPFNASRRIIGFDSYKGYVGFTAQDRKTDFINVGAHSVSYNYREYLEKLVAFHERNNILHNIRKHELIEGDITKSAPQYFKNHPETIVALAYFDIALYEPTKAGLKAIKPHLIPGSVLLMDELNSPDAPGETIAFREVMDGVRYKIRKSRYITDRSIVVIQ